MSAGGRAAAHIQDKHPARHSGAQPMVDSEDLTIFEITVQGHMTIFGMGL
jgi:hypothetical protein